LIKKKYLNSKKSFDIGITVDRTSPGEMIDLHRMTVDEALPALDRYLNRAFMAGLNTVYIMHGKGTGTIKRATITYMNSHPLVRALRPAWADEGGDGVTVAVLVN